jgi:hypothetical protein
VGTAFSAIAGSYSPSPTSSAYQWELCDSNGANCSNISGATTSSYTPAASDVGSTLKVIETVSESGYNDGGSTSAASAAVVKGSFTTNSAVSINGTPTVGTATSITQGSYSPSPTSRAYQWQLCDSNGANCSNINGATNSSYTPVAGDVGSTLVVVETVSKSGYNDGGSTSAASAAVVKGSFTTNSAVAINGTPTVGTATTITQGSYSPAPTSRAYQWELCDSNGANCSNISGATTSSYTPAASDVGSTLKVIETVSESGYNDGGSTSAASAAVVKGSFTTNSAVSINGTPTVGTATSITQGSYSPAPTSRAYQWELCDSNGANCSNITGATNSSYTPAASDVGSTLKVVETVSKSGYNDGGSTSSASAAVVKGSFTTNSAVSTSGTPTVGTAFSAIAGSYSPTPASSSYQWELCDSNGANCSNINGATTSSYTPAAGDVGSTLKVVETVSKSGYNDGGSTSAASSAVVKGSFITNSAVSTSGTPTVGTAFSAIAGSYSPSPTSSAYQWELCDSNGANCSNITGATNSSYTPVAGDVGSTLVVVETVSKSGYNDGGSTSSASAQVVNGDFTVNSAVSVSGTPTVGTAFGANPGSYTPNPTSRSYQWELCDGSGNNCSNINGATGPTYTPAAGDVGSTLVVVESVSKAGYNNNGSLSSVSAQVVKGSFTTNTAVAINGTPTVGTASTITQGSYSPTPTSRSYQWELCDSNGANCSDINGATTSSYTPVAGDVGSTLVVVETVSKSGYNDGGSTSAASAAVVKGSFTTNTAVSTSGTPTVGTAFAAIAGSYSPTPASASYQWELCDSNGANCSNITGATNSSYTPVAGDVGSTLRVVETVSKSGYNDGGSTSAASSAVVKGSFITNSAVSTSGTPTVGTAFSAIAGSYSPTPASASYQWELCDSNGANCSNINGATNSSYTPVAGDVGSTLRVVETVSKAGYNDGGSTSTASAAVVKGSFTTNTAVAINGTPTVGTATSITQGSYSPSPTSRAYQWQLCDSNGANCSNINGATTSSYTPVAGDVGSTLVVVETVSKSGYNDSGSTSAASAAVVKGSFTTSSAVSTSGTPTVGTAFSAIAGSYSPTPASASYQWELCDSNGANCSNITGATNSSYTPAASDVGSTLKVVETVSKAGYNDGGSTSAASSAVVKGSFTTNSAVAINGTPTVGTATTITQGSYSPSPTSRAYQWELCDSNGANCSNINGATTSSYTPVAGDVGSTLVVVETVSKAGYNDSGSTSAASAQVVNGSFTTNSAVSVSGTPVVGDPFTATAGSYSPSPASRTYQWELCDSNGANCSNITGATNSSYTPVSGDVGSTLKVIETVSKAGYDDSGSTSAASNPVAAGSIVTNTAVAINGTPTVGTATTITPGSYTPTPTSRAYQWELCDSNGANCSNIGGATSSTYTPVAGDVGSTLRVVETASKSGYGDGTSTSAASPAVVNGDFTTNSAVSLSGTPTVGTAFGPTPGSYSPTPESASYQWELCDGAGNNCSNINGATGPTYTPAAGDVGSTLVVVETVSKAGYNDGGSTSAASAAVVKGSFTTNSAVAVNGTPTVGTATSITQGSYSPAPTSRAYQWELCDSNGANCSSINGATTSSYTPVAGDVGSTLRIVETVSKSGYNDGASTSAASSAVVKGSFTTNTAVSTSDTPTVGTAFAAIAGSYSPTPASSSYQWELCDSNGANCSNITGATNSSYTPAAGDVGSTLRVVETVSKSGYNDGGSTSSASAAVVKGSFTTNSAVSANGIPTVGTAFAATPGNYTPTPASASYQWELCDSNGANCANITGATNSSYTPAASDVGSTLKVVEMVSKSGYNDGGSTSAASAAVVKGSFTTNTAVAINGTPTVGTATSITQGSYSPAPTSRAYQWELCDSNGANCSNINGATNSSYTPVAGDVGSTLIVVETVSKSGYNDSGSTSSASAAVVKGSFTTNSAVSTSGTPTVGTAFSAIAGSYSPTPASSSYQWELCDSNGANCSNINGATTSSYTPAASDVGSTLKVIETVSKSGYNDGGSTSAASAAVVKGSFTTNSAVSINGTPTVGTATSITQGSYSPSPTSRAYQWQLCDGSGNNCSNINGATNSSYTPAASDVGSTLKVVETVSKSGYNDGGSTSAASAAVVKGSFTTNSAVSTSGTPTVGTAFSAIAGSYSPTPTSASYQWQLCDSNGANCSSINGATTSSYTPAASDLGSTLVVVETVSKSGYNDGGSTSAASAAVVKGSFTTNSAVSTSGTPTVGTAFSAIAGSYSPSPASSSYQWELCDSNGANCSNITGATTSSYTPAASDVGSTLKVIETVSKSGYNDGGSTSAASAAVVKGSFTTNSAVSINGTPTVGTATTLTQGSYSPAPTSRAYQWQLCDGSGNNCSNINGATTSSYTPTASDVGSTLKVVETVSKSGYNDGTSTSAASAAVIKGSFTTNSAVSTSGTPKVGTAFSAIAGSYAPSPTSSAYQWKLCDSSGNNCSNINGATSSSYTPQPGDLGSTLKVVETVSKSGYNDGGSTSTASAQIVKGDFTTNTAVAINGTPTIGTATTLTPGSYTPSPASRTYQWELCDSSGNNCSNINGATSNTYTPVSGDLGSTLRVVESVSATAYNDGGSTSSASAQVVKGPITTNTAVSLSGTPTVGTAFTRIAGSYTPTPTTRAYQWQLCDSNGNNCSNIGGATNASYTPAAGDVGSTLRVVETVSKSGYSDGSSTSGASVPVVNGDFSTTTPVSVSGTPVVGSGFTATPGVYFPGQTSGAYQWQLCDSSGNNCTNINGATSIRYYPVPTDVGSTLRVVQTVSRAGYNDGGSTSGASSPVVKGDVVTNAAVAVSGNPAVGTATALTAGSYTPAPTSRSYQWELCDSSGNNCSNISGATSTKYTPQPSDAGSTLRVVESVSRVGYNDNGSTSSASTPVASGDFSTTTAVAIVGTPAVGTSTSITKGSYSPSPTSRVYQWELCDSNGANCSNIPGATNSFYTPQPSDVGSTLRIVETVSRGGYNDGSSTSSPATVVNGDFVTNAPVSVSGTPVVASAFTATPGVYFPGQTSGSYQWQLCDSTGNNCSNISGATSVRYYPVPSDVGSTLRVVQTVSRAGYNDGGSTSSASVPVAKADFVTNAAIAIVGTPTVGTASRFAQGTYSPGPSSRSYQWQLCDSSGNNCSNIPGATGSVYTPQATDSGSTLRVVETVSRTGYNDGGSTSAASTTINGDIVTNVPVAINAGTPTVGTPTTITKGAYTPAGTRTYQWETCDTGGANCSAIPGATNTTYTPQAGDVGSTLRVIETVTRSGYNDGGSTSDPSAVVIKGDFVTNSGVSVSGTPTVASGFLATAGSYSPGQTTTSYQWELCDGSGNNCSNIPGATSRRYYPVPTDVGSTLVVVETVSKAGYNDSGSISSASSPVIKGDFVTNAAVAINGTPAVGTTTTVAKGTYTPAPTSRSYQWELCNSSGNNCSNIPGATNSFYTPVPSDVGSTLVVVESISRAGINDNSSTSAASPVVVKGSFVTNSAVSVSGTPTVAQAFTATPGSYSPGQTTTSYQWQSCDSSGNNCSNIPGAVYRKYYPVPGDVGSTLRIVETVTRSGYNDSGSTSAASVPVAKGNFVVNTAVSLTGTPAVGAGFLAVPGSYAPGQTTTSYQWQLCDNNGNNCSNIAGATNRRYYPVATDLGLTLRVVESVSRAGYNDNGSTSNASNAVVKGDFSTTTAVSINGNPTVGTAVTLTKGVYNPGPTTRTYQWQLCDASGNNCQNITGATSATYTPVPSDAGSTLRVVETVSRAGYNDGHATSAASSVVT